MLGSGATRVGVGGMGIRASLEPMSVARYRIGVFPPSSAPRSVANTSSLLWNAYRVVFASVTSHMPVYSDPIYGNVN